MAAHQLDNSFLSINFKSLSFWYTIFFIAFVLPYNTNAFSIRIEQNIINLQQRRCYQRLVLPSFVSKATQIPGKRGCKTSEAMIRRSSSLADDDNDERISSVPIGEQQSGILKQQQSLGTPRFTVGVLADIQYAPVPDGFSFSGNPRYYKHSLNVAKHAADHFENDGIDVLLNLGDTIDGKCQEIEQHGGAPIPDGVDPGHKSIEDVMNALSAYKRGPVLHSYGNHCLYNLSRQSLSAKMGVPFVKEPCGELVGYTSHVHKGIRFIVLDSYDVAILQRCEQTSQKRKEAMKILEQNNPNYPDNFNSPEGLEGLKRRFVGFNGAVGRHQLDWLEQTLSEARELNEKAILLSHQPLHPGSTNPVCLVWNYEDVLNILRGFSDVVVASFAGHAHHGGYERDKESGIHFRVFEAALESYPEKTYAIVDVHDDSLSVRGFGDCMSAIYDFDHTTTSRKENKLDTSTNFTSSTPMMEVIVE